MRIVRQLLCGPFNTFAPVRRTRHRLLWLFSLWLGAGGRGGGAQEQASGAAGELFPLERHAELREELSYTPPRLPRERDGAESPWEWLNPDLGWLSDLPPLGKLVLLLLILLPIGLLIYSLLGFVAGRRARRGGEPANEGAVRVEELEEERLVNRGIDPDLVARAEAAGQYAVAVRLHYLQLLIDLRDAGAIRYRKDFSNRDYRRQLASDDLAPAFSALTVDYERHWYGEYPLDPLSYRLIKQRFGELSARVRRRIPHPTTSQDAD